MELHPNLAFCRDTAVPGEALTVELPGAPSPMTLQWQNPAVELEGQWRHGVSEPSSDQDPVVG